MAIEINTVIRIISAFQFMLVALFLLTHKRGNQLGNRILAVFLLSKALSLTESLLYQFKSALSDRFPHAFLIAGTFVFLFGPSIYFYVKSMTYQDFKLKKQDVAHVMPFATYWVFLLFKFHFHSADVKRALLATGYHLSYYAALFINLFLFLQVFGYLVAALLVLRRYRAAIKNSFSSIERINLSWLNNLLWGFILIWVLEFSNFIVLMSTGRSVPLLMTISLVLILIFANFVVFKGLKQPEVFSGIREKQKYKNSVLTQTDKERYLKKLKIYMEREKPYLDPALTLEALAQRLLILPRYLSQVINESLGQNFFDFINHYRVKEATQHLKNPSDKKTILEILYNVGFNSKSAFNCAFKKYTGMTPSEFKNSTN